MMHGFGLFAILLSLGCTEVEAPGSVPSSARSELPTPPREVQKVSLELRSALTLDAPRGFYEELLIDFSLAELDWLAARQIEHLDRVHALVGSRRAEAARAGRVAPIIFHDIALLRPLILAEPDLERGLRPGGVPNTVTRLLEHSRIQTRSSMAIFDSETRDLESRLLNPELSSTDAHLSRVETEMLLLQEQLVQIHLERLRLLPWLFQFLDEAGDLDLLEDPVVAGWLFAQEALP